MALISLGCPKNLVDSENMLALIKDAHLEITDKFSEAEIIIVNTCGFINSAKEESINTILEMAEYKKIGNCKVLIVVGCLVQKYQEELMVEIPEIDAFLGTHNYQDIVETIYRVLNNEKVVQVNKEHTNKYFELPRYVYTSKHYAYVRIAEGCNNCCTYCAIPQIRGPFRSRPQENIVDEVKNLVANGVKEVILVAQDTTQYGIDIYGKFKLVSLLEELSKIAHLRWIRLLYCYPNYFSDELIQVIRDEPKICKYIDLPIQHADNTILKKMGRRITWQEIKSLIMKLRNNIPNIIIRSTFIVGFPGESREHYNNLLKFLKDTKLDRVGAFTYSREEDTPAGKMLNQVSENIKNKRLEKLMELQYKIILEKHEQYIGQELIVQVDGSSTDNENLWICRSQGEAPEIDPVILVYYPKPLKPGDLLLVKITHLHDYDLIGEINRELT
ncbi:MAG: ribosomal protein methylthiotransferase [Clostridia bacterium]|nr:ribosomal protein methylthiotransferase [Clostridia bacterium]MDN5323281.1 ribosomal protein methylthiotransferase [Clostridia bacterium]